MKTLNSNPYIEPGLEYLGITNIKKAHWNNTSASLYEHAIKNGEAKITHLGPLVVSTGKTTGRSPNDKYIVKGSLTLSSREKLTKNPMNKRKNPMIINLAFVQYFGE